MPKQKTYTFSLIDIEWFKQVVFKSRMARFLCSAIHAGAIELLNAFDIFSVCLLEIGPILSCQSEKFYNQRFIKYFEANGPGEGRREIFE